MEQYRIYCQQFLSKIKNVEAPPILLSTVLVSMVISVLISVGVSSKELTKRLGEYHDDIAGEQRGRLETLEKEVSRMKIKQKEAESLVTSLRGKVDTKFLLQNASIEFIRSLVSDVSDK